MLIPIYQNKHDIDEVLKFYESTKKNASPKRKTYIKKFLLFCLEQELTISSLALHLFMQHRGLTNRTIYSMLNVFRKFCEHHKIQGLLYQIKKQPYKGENQYVLRYLAQNDFKNERTKICYQNELNLFFRFLSKESLNFGQISVQQYLQISLSKGLSIFTLNLRLAVFKSFVKWFLKQKDLLKNINEDFISDISSILTIKVFRGDTSKYYKESLSIDERDSIMQQIGNLKEKTVIALQVFEGLRASELCDLKVKHFDLANATLQVLGKGKYKRETIRLFAYTLELVQQIIQHNKLKQEDLLFGKLNYPQVYKIVKKYLPNHSPHSLRHTAAQIMVEKGWDKEFVQTQLRHADYRTTQIYTKKMINKLFLERMPKEI